MSDPLLDATAITALLAEVADELDADWVEGADRPVGLDRPAEAAARADGQDRIQTAPWLAIIPGIAIVLTVLSLNVFGDGLRDALDPRAKVKVGR